MGLYYYASNWHLIAYCRLRNDYRDFRVGRISDLKIKNKKIDSKKHALIKEIVTRTMKTADLKEIIIKFKKSHAKYLHDQKYYYGFIKEKEFETQIEMTFLSYSYSYFSRWLLMYIDTVEIIKPNELKDIMKKLFQKLYNNYQCSYE